MNVTVVPYTEAHEAAFDAFVALSRNGTLFHTRRFLSYHLVGRFRDASLLFMRNEKICAVLPAALREENGKKALVSHPGASYGGLVLGPTVSVAETGEILTALMHYAITEKYDSISMLRLAPASLQRSFSEDQQYWLFQQGYQMTRSEMDGAIDLTRIRSESILESLTGKCRNMVRQAERANITVRLSNDFTTFWPLLEALLTQRHAAKPTHTLSEIQKLHTLFPEGFRLLAAYQGEVMVGGIVLITIHSEALYTLYMAQEYARQHQHPMHLLLVEAMRLTLSEKKKILHLGVSTEDGGKKINEGLFFFKESFGCMPVRRETWERVL